MKRLTLLLALLLTAMAASAQQYLTLTDIPYSKSADAYAQERCKLDVYYPTDLKDCPVVVWFHGGGLTGGNKFIPQELKNSKLVVVADNYRLMPQATSDDCIDDAAAAVAWTFDNIGAYNGSADKIFVAGHSDGGYLTDMIGLDKHWLAKYGIDADRVAGLIPFSGQLLSHYNYRQTLGMTPYQPLIDAYAPLAHVRADAPPIVIISGDRELELYGRYEETAYFWRLLKMVGHPDATLYELQGFGHGNMADPAVQILKDNVRRILRARNK